LFAASPSIAGILKSVIAKIVDVVRRGRNAVVEAIMREVEVMN
jgi:hypothetical protein